jgi:hypothetical protein
MQNTIIRLIHRCNIHRSRKMSHSYATEEQVAVAAVRRACHLTSSVFNKLVKNETLTKGDKSPVTGMNLSTTLLPPATTMIDLFLILSSPSPSWRLRSPSRYQLHPPPRVSRRSDRWGGRCIGPTCRGGQGIEGQNH